jgi:hypothetical protein
MEVIIGGHLSGESNAMMKSLTEPRRSREPLIQPMHSRVERSLSSMIRK